MIFAILPDASKTESLLNSLSEAEFDLKNVSVVMRDKALKGRIAQEAGPLSGVHEPQLESALRNAGLSEQQAHYLVDAVAHDKVLIAMKVDPRYEPAAREMFQDVHAEVLEE